MNIKTKELRWSNEGEKPNENEGEIISPNLAHFQPSDLGTIRVKMADGTIKELKMNRAERRRFIRQYKLMPIAEKADKRGKNW